MSSPTRSSHPAQLNPLRSRHASQGALVLPPSYVKPQPLNRISVGAARTNGDLLAANSSDLVTPLSIISESPKNGGRLPAVQGSPTGSSGSNLPRYNSIRELNALQHLNARLSSSHLDSLTPESRHHLENGDGELSRKKEDSPNHRFKASGSPPRSLKNLTGQPEIDDTSNMHHLPATGLVYDAFVETKEVEDLCLAVGLTRKDVRKLRRQFTDEDADNTDTITQSAFFFLIDEERHNLSRRLFRIAGLPPTQSRFTFDQYLKIVCTFSTFSEPELLKFFFDVFAVDSQDGSIMVSEIQNLGKELQDANKSTSKNISIATKRMVSSRNVIEVASAQHHHTQAADSVLTFADFERLVKKNLVAFYPLLLMQRNVRQATLGEAFWNAKTREKKAVHDILHFMAQHDGQMPELPWTDRLMTSLFRVETTGSRARAQAKNLYANGSARRATT